MGTSLTPPCIFARFPSDFVSSMRVKARFWLAPRQQQADQVKIHATWMGGCWVTSNLQMMEFGYHQTAARFASWIVFACFLFVFPSLPPIRKIAAPHPHPHPHPHTLIFGEHILFLWYCTTTVLVQMGYPLCRAQKP